MKFRSICAVLTAVIGLTTGSSSAEVALGVKGGLNLSRSYGSDIDGFYDMVGMAMRPGLAVGAALQIKLSDYFAIQPEALFSCKGYKMEMSEDLGLDEYDETEDISFGDALDITTKISVRYIEVPILLQLLIPAGPVTPQIYAGPAIAFKTGLAGKVEFMDETIDMEDEEADAISDAMKTVDFGIAMGAGLGIKAGPGSLILDARFTLGLVKVDDSGTAKDKNMALSFLGGYMFEF